MTFSAELFVTTAREAEKYVSAAGYSMTQIKQNAETNSHFAEFKNGDESIVFLCDGNENWLRIVKRNAANAIFDEELFFRGNLLSASVTEQQRAMSDAVNLLQNYFSHTHDDDEITCGCSHHHG